MELMSEKPFYDVVTSALSAYGCTIVKVDDMNKKKIFLNGGRFYDLHRSSGKHRPDFGIKRPGGIVCPVEIKSTQELYKYGRYSSAHLTAYFLQSIYGQCSSYAELYHHDDDTEVALYLIVPKEVGVEPKTLGNVEPIFESVVEAQNPLESNNVRIRASFRCPEFCTEGGAYGRLHTSEGPLLCTRIKYTFVPEE